MARHDDELGNAIKEAEAVESSRSAGPDEAVVVRVDGASFSKFTARMAKPFDERLHAAMVAAASRVVDGFRCRLGYTQSDEATFVIWEPNGVLPHDGRLQKLASRVASLFTAEFVRTGLALFPEAMERKLPDFDGRANGHAPDLAARIFEWRQLDARKNAVNAAARAHFPHGSLDGKSSRTMREMLEGVGVTADSYPTGFTRGTFVRRVTEARILTPEELARIPEGRRPTGPVKRSRVTEVTYPPLNLLTNLTAVVLDGAEPQAVREPGFAGAVTP